MQAVSLCVREWIETEMARAVVYGITVSLCVREWIETKFPYVVGQPAAMSPSA